jgi:hypothetical protein
MERRGLSLHRPGGPTANSPAREGRVKCLLDSTGPKDRHNGAVVSALRALMLKPWHNSPASRPGLFPAGPPDLLHLSLTLAEPQALRAATTHRIWNSL